MNDITCDAVLAVLPDWILGSLPEQDAAAVSTHVATCGECGREAALIRAVRGAKPEVPPGLESRIQAALRVDPVVGDSAPTRPRHWWPPQPRWGLAAAVLVLALGTAVIWPQVRGPLPVAPAGSLDDDALLAEGWGTDRGIVAGVPVIEELSDEQLLALLQELGG